MTKLFREALRRLGISQPQAAVYLDVGERTVRRWCRDDVQEPADALDIVKRAIRADEELEKRLYLPPITVFTKRAR